MQDTIVFQIMQEGQGGAGGVAAHEYGSASDALRWVLRQAFHKKFQGQRAGREAFSQKFATSLPGCHDGEQAEADHQWEPTSGSELESVGAEEGQFNDEKQPTPTGRFGDAPGPKATRSKIEKHRG